MKRVPSTAKAERTKDEIKADKELRKKQMNIITAGATIGMALAISHFCWDDCRKVANTLSSKMSSVTSKFLSGIRFAVSQEIEKAQDLLDDNESVPADIQTKDVAEDPKAEDSTTKMQSKKKRKFSLRELFCR